MDNATATFYLFGLEFDWPTVLSTLLVGTIMVVLAVIMTRNLKVRPSGKGQLMMEWLIDFTGGIVNQALPNKKARKYGLYIFTLFFFIFVSNQLGLILQLKFGDVTYIKSPTATPLVTMTLALISLMIAHGSGVEELGLKKYLANAFLTPSPWLLPLNIIEQLAKFLSLSLRLFGNIFAGEVLLEMIAEGLALPHDHFVGIFNVILGLPLEMAWQSFSLFIGAIQAYVFVILTSVYIGEAQGEE